MRLKNFIAWLEDAGWSATGDAQHTEIKKFHRRLFPVVAELEDELEEAKADLLEALERTK